jgi:hypothetical protein
MLTGGKQMTQSDCSEVTVFLQTEILNGSIHISTPNGRLLDQLNKDSEIGPFSLDIFTKLTDVVIWHLDGSEQKLSSVQINSTTVQMVGTDGMDSNREASGNSNLKPYLYIEKLPVLVGIDMPGYEISGNMYRISHQKLENVLKERVTFMPLTDAYISSTVNGKKWHLPFLAVNKRLILSLHDWDIIPAAPLPL